MTTTDPRTLATDDDPKACLRDCRVTDDNYPAPCFTHPDVVHPGCSRQRATRATVAADGPTEARVAVLGDSLRMARAALALSIDSRTPGNERRSRAAMRHLDEINADLRSLLAAQTRVRALEAEVAKWREVGGPTRARTVAGVLTHERVSEVRFLATDTELFDWWFRNGLTEDITDEGATVWWADSVAEEERVTVGTNIREAIGKAMRGIYDDDDPAPALASRPEPPSGRATGREGGTEGGA